jgi:hypothetical protein
MDLDSASRICRSLNAELFGSQVDVGLFWHSIENPAMATCNPQLRTISLREDWSFLPRWQQAAVLTHELAHLHTANETVPGGHGVRWSAVMWRVGMCPGSGQVMSDSPLARWLEQHSW